MYTDCFRTNQAKRPRLNYIIEIVVIQVLSIDYQFKIAVLLLFAISSADVSLFGLKFFCFSPDNTLFSGRNACFCLK